MVAEITVGGLFDGAYPESGIEGYEFKDQSGKTTGLNVRSTSQCQTARIKACRRYSCITGLVVVGTRQRLRSGTWMCGKETARHGMPWHQVCGVSSHRPDPVREVDMFLVERCC
ncbi:hypothetical protein VFPPC_17686 [Pochonia chlamydosporia 170]|uniref:Uncharacterized protein n=1 Tax=Pochonia chlamydosporia 170 TaxID=1380566 RepID=A0A219AQT0_METCM|nr:hypothetical protein VFPPC_17686 [Pochonia chlamydosporia 170]OWT43138.1 hypothetical protein VFPPC_17686 [Pochonia chlamydosporia 170]